MSWTNRVVWQEGMFLRTQHFQQQDRWTEQLVRGRVQALRPHPVGPGRIRAGSRPARHRPLRAGLRLRRVRGRHAVRAARRDRPSAAARTAGERAQCAGVSRAADPPGGRGRGRRQRHRGPLRRAAVRGVRHAFGVAAARRVAGRPAAHALSAGDRRTHRISVHRLGARDRGHRGSPHYPRRTVDAAIAGMLRRARRWRD